MAEKTVQVNLRMEQSLKEAVERAAGRDHRTLTGFIEKVLIDHLRAEADLDDWHARALRRFGGLLAENQTSTTGVLARSYSIHTRSGERIEPHDLIRLLELTFASLKNFTTSAGLFYPYTRKELIPYFTADGMAAKRGPSEILECAAFPPVVHDPSFWRVSAEGLATDIRPHFEDIGNFSNSELVHGKWFGPLYLVHHVAELVIHAGFFSDRFRTAESVEFRCEWTGLLERELRNLDRFAGDWLGSSAARVDGRTTEIEWPARELLKEWPKVVSALAGPVMRLFDPTFDCSPEWVQQQIDIFHHH